MAFWPGVLVVVLILSLFVPVSVSAETAVIANGRVTDAATGLPVAGAYLSATYLYPDVEGEELADETVTDTNGTYTLDDPQTYGAAYYRLHVSAPDYVPQWIERYWDGVTPLMLNLSLAPVRTVSTGLVKDADTGLPIAGAAVYLSYNVYEFEWVTIDDDITAADGRYTILDPFGYGAGSYEFSVYASGHIFQVQSVTWDGVTPLALDFTLPPTRTIAAGSVTNALTSSPVANTTIQAYWFDGFNWVPAYSTASSVDGTYVLSQSEVVHSPGVAGSYQFVTSAAGYITQTQYGTWDGNTPLAIDFPLIPNSPPMAAADAYSTAKNTKLTVAAPGILQNDKDIDGDTLSAVIVAGPSVGTLTLSSNGSFTYVPKKNWTGTTSFTYRAFDGISYSNTVTVTITVAASSGGGGRPR